MDQNQPFISQVIKGSLNNESLSGQHSEQKASKPNKKKQLTKHLTSILYSHCPNNKSKIFDLFWSSYSNLTTNIRIKEKNFMRRFNEILNAMQASGFIRINNKEINVISERNQLQIGEEQHMQFARNTQKLEQCIALKQQLDEKAQNYQSKELELHNLRKLINALGQNSIRKKKLKQEQRDQIGLDGIFLMADKHSLTVIENNYCTKKEDHQLTMRGKFEELGQLSELLTHLHFKQAAGKRQGDIS